MNINIRIGPFSSGTPAFSETRTQTVPHQPGAGLHVRTDNGAISAQRSARADVQISARIKAETDERLKATRITAVRAAGGTLQVAVEWPAGGRKSSEGCDFEILLPEAQGLDLATGNGAVEARGLAGPARLRASNGKIFVTAHAGAVQAESSNGAVVIEEASAAVEARTSNGAIEVRLAQESPGPVQLVTSNGSVALVLGRAFAGTLELSTTNGHIVVEPASRGAAAASAGFGAVMQRITLGSGQPVSSVRTSNGSIRVSFQQG